MFHLTALEGRRRVLGEERMKSLASMGSMGVLCGYIKDWQGVLSYFHQALTLEEKLLGKTHHSILLTIKNMANTFMEGLTRTLKR